MTPLEAVIAIDKFAIFMRFLAAPTQSSTTPGGNASITEGFNAFVNIGCAQCHTQQLQNGRLDRRGAAKQDRAGVLGLRAPQHGSRALRMTSCRVRPAGDEFRTAPLWGLGQRVFFLHDGRTKNLLTAIQAHRSNGNGTYAASEANTVIDRFNALAANKKQEMLNFLRSL